MFVKKIYGFAMQLSTFVLLIWSFLNNGADNFPFSNLCSVCPLCFSFTVFKILIFVICKQDSTPLKLFFRVFRILMKSDGYLHGMQ